MKLTNKQTLIITIPIALLFLGFGIYNFIPKSENKEEKIVYDGSEILPDPTATDTSTTLQNKKHIYQRESESNAIKKEMMNKLPSDDDFFSGDIPTEVKAKEASTSEFSMDERLARQEKFDTIPTVKPVHVDKPKIEKKKSAPKKIIVPEENLNALRKFDANGNEITTTGSSNKGEKNIESEEKKISRREWFYNSQKGETSKKNSIESTPYINAVIHNSQTVRSGSTVKMRITQDCIINGVAVQRNTYVSGICTFTNERVIVKITSLNINNSYLKTDLSVYEADGMEGIYVPGGVNQEIASDAVTSAISGTRINANIPFVGSISTGANKKINDPSVVLPSNYKLLLKTN